MASTERVFEGVNAVEQLTALEQRALDTRPALTTPFPAMNKLLHRGGFHPGELVVLGGRKGTRKSTVALNMAVHLLQQDVPVGILTLDESLAMYVSKTMSVIARHSPEYIETCWNQGDVQGWRSRYKELASGLTMSTGVRPNIDQLQQWLEWDFDAPRPRVVFIDYCPEESTRLLTADLRWVPAGDVKSGDLLVGFDEAGRYRKLRFSEVLRNAPGVQECVRVYTDRGELVVSADHPFLVSAYEKAAGRPGAGNTKSWRTRWSKARDLRPGIDHLKLLAEPWTSDLEDSWFAGMWDGEGWVGPSHMWVGKEVQRSTAKVAVVAVERVGDRTTARVATSTGTFITEGFLSHNTSLLVHYRARENERVPRLFEELQVWTGDNDLVTVALHQAGRTDEGVSKKYHGATPMTAEGLLYGGEQQADIIFSTYRPAMDPLGNMSRQIAEMVMGDNFDEDRWKDAVARVRRYKRSTMLQLLKNRPSTKGEWFEGDELWSPDDSLYIEEKGEGVNNDANWQEGE